MSSIEARIDLEAETLTLVIPLNRITQVASDARDPAHAIERGRIRMAGYTGPMAYTIRVRPSDDRDQEPITVHVNRETHAALMARLHARGRF